MFGTFEVKAEMSSDMPRKLTLKILLWKNMGLNFQPMALNDGRFSQTSQQFLPRCLLSFGKKFTTSAGEQTEWAMSNSVTNLQVEHWKLNPGVISNCNNNSEGLNKEAWTKLQFPKFLMQLLITRICCFWFVIKEQNCSWSWKAMT